MPRADLSSNCCPLCETREGATRTQILIRLILWNHKLADTARIESPNQLDMAGKRGFEPPLPCPKPLVLGLAVDGTPKNILVRILEKVERIEEEATRLTALTHSFVPPERREEFLRSASQIWQDATAIGEIASRGKSFVSDPD